jgi:hypothetical protein
MVGLIREPENAYDGNAIRVENIAAEKVGHLNRQLAAQVGMSVCQGPAQNNLGRTLSLHDILCVQAGDIFIVVQMSGKSSTDSWHSPWPAVRIGAARR